MLDAPIISDFEFDKLLVELKQLEDKNPDLFDANSPTQRVGGKPLKEFSTITHRLPMQSLANAMNIGELETFDKQAHRLLKLHNTDIIEYIGEPKLDGLAVELVYEKGKFVRKKIETGISDGINIEILSGLELEDKIKVWNKTEPFKLDEEEEDKN